MMWLKIIPVVIGILIGGAGTATLLKYVQPKIEIPECPQCPQCPAISTIEFDKIKNFKGTLKIDNQIWFDADSLFTEKLMQEIRAELKAQKIVKCR
jgi:hypothetical protein